MLGEKGNGIVQIDQSYVIIISDTEVGDIVCIERTESQDNVVFATIIDQGRQ